MQGSCERSLADMPPRVQCLSVFLGAGAVFSLGAVLLHHDDATFAVSWLPFLVGVLLAHALTFLFFIDAVERQAVLFIQRLLQPAGLAPSHGLDVPALEAVLFVDPLERRHPLPEMEKAPSRGAGHGVWESLTGKAVLAVFVLLSLGLTLVVATAAFPGARDLAHDAVTMPGALAVLALLGGGALASQRLRASRAMDAARQEALREALASLFGTLDWQSGVAAEHVPSRSTSVRKERQEADGRTVARNVVVTRQETIQDRTAHLARVELLLDPANLSHRVLMALLRQAAGVHGLEQDARALSPLGFSCLEAGDCRRFGRSIARQELLTMAMHLAQHLLAEDDWRQRP